VIQAV